MGQSMKILNLNSYWWISKLIKNPNFCADQAFIFYKVERYEVEAAKKALTKATDDLNQLADYCESSFNQPEVVQDLFNDNDQGMLKHS